MSHKFTDLTKRDAYLRELRQPPAPPPGVSSPLSLPDRLRALADELVHELPYSSIPTRDDAQHVLDWLNERGMLAIAEADKP